MASADVDQKTLTETAFSFKGQTAPTTAVEKSTTTARPTEPQYMIAKLKQYAAARSKQTLVVMRCGERMDRIFPQWLSNNVDERGQYFSTDINHPNHLPTRRNGMPDFDNDSPITELGMLTTQMLSRGLFLSGAVPSYVFCSPALRCIQTAEAALKQTRDSNLKIRVEPGLFEYGKWYHKMPNFMNEQELIDNKIPIDTEYQPVMSFEELNSLVRTESLSGFYERIGRVCARIAQSTLDPGVVLLVTHSPCVDAAARSLVRKGKEPLNALDLAHMGVHYPYCSFVSLNRKPRVDADWAPVDNMLPPINYVDFCNRVNARFLNR